MEPVLKMYMFHHYLEDINEDVELAKNHGYLVGSFINPEAAKQIFNNNNYTTTDEEFEESWKMVEESSKKAEQQNKPKRRRRKKSN